MREELKVRGKNGLLPFRGLEYFGFSIDYIKDWRAREHSAGRPSGLEDFYELHGLCIDCLSKGVRDIGWSEPSEMEIEAANERGMKLLPLYEVCPTCDGTGKADRSKWERSSTKV